MGISTLQSYRGAQIFEALGLDKGFVDEYFTGTVSRIGGADLGVIAQETLLRHKAAFEVNSSDPGMLVSGGLYQWKRDGEFHLWNPDSIAALQDAARNNDSRRYAEFANLINDQSAQPATLRRFLNLKKRGYPAGRGRAVEQIVKRFATGAMSFGSISAAAHETIAIAMNRLGGNPTGEGGEDPAFRSSCQRPVQKERDQAGCQRAFRGNRQYLVNATRYRSRSPRGQAREEGSFRGIR
jgi:glutamate synthase domain-containing protein 2